MSKSLREQNKTKDLFDRLVEEGRSAQLQALMTGKKLTKEERSSLLNGVDDNGGTCLHVAAYCGQESIIAWITAEGEGGGRLAGFKRILAKDKNGTTALLVAAATGHLGCVQALVKGSRVENGERDELLNDTDDEGRTVLHCASHFDHPSIVAWLLSDTGGRSLGFNNVLARENAGLTSLHLASRLGSFGCVEALLEGSKIENGEREELLHAVSDNGWTIIHFAANFGHPLIIQLILSLKEEETRFRSVLAQTPNNGFTALHLATQKGHLVCIEALAEGCKRNAEESEQLFNAVDGKGNNALHMAAFDGHEAIVKWLLSDSGGRAAGFKNISAQSNNGMTAFHRACSKNHLSCLQALAEGSKVDNGEREALLNVVDDEQWTVLHYAVHCGHASIISWLLSETGGIAAGFKNILARGKDHTTALHFAARKGHLPCIQALAQQLCSSSSSRGDFAIREREELFNAVDKNGQTALHYAAYFGHAVIIVWLLSDAESRGRSCGFAGVAARDVSGRTAFDVAAQRGHLPCVQALMKGSNAEEREALLNNLDERGWTALHHAVHFGHATIISWLLSDETESSGGGGRTAWFKNILNITSEGLNAMHIAADSGRLPCVLALVQGCKAENGEREELLNAIDITGGTALHRAAYFGHPSIVSWLLSRDDEEEGNKGGRTMGFKNVTLKANNGLNALLVAVGEGHLECCRAIVEGSSVEEREEMINTVYATGKTALHRAVQCGYPAVISWLLSDEEGGGRAAGFSNIVSKTTDGYNALHFGSQLGNLLGLQALVAGCKTENGEREELLNAVDGVGWTALHHCAQQAHTECIEWLLSETGGRAAGLKSSTITAVTGDRSHHSLLHLAAIDGSVDSLRAILVGCTPAERLTLFLTIDDRGWSLLHWAARRGFPDIVRELLLHHPETKTIVDARDYLGLSVLHRAIIRGLDDESRAEWGNGAHRDYNHWDIVRALLSLPPVGGGAAAIVIAGEEEDDELPVAIDVNLGLKIE